MPYGLAIGVGFMFSPVVQARGAGYYGVNFGWHFAATVLLAHAGYGMALGRLISRDHPRQEPVPKAIGENMKISGLALVLLLAASSAVGQGPRLGPKDGPDLSAADLQRVRVGGPAPDFTLESKDGNLITLSSFRDKKNVVLVFYRGYW